MFRAIAVALAWSALLSLGVATPSAAASQLSEMEILDLYLEQFDTARGAEGVWVDLVLDRCHRTGGAESTSTLDPLASADSTNDLMFQHTRWHGGHGRLVDPVFTWSDSDPYGVEFLEYHRDLVTTYVDWREKNGHAALAPWDPVTPIPAAFAYPVATPCLARESEDPRIALPTFLTTEGGTDRSPFWGYASLCDIPDANRLGKTIEGSWYHADVHLAIGGDMADAGLTLRDPIFWPWHIHVQGIYETWMACASQEGSAGVAIGQAADGKGVPGPALATVLLVLAAAAWSSTRT